MKQSVLLATLLLIVFAVCITGGLALWLWKDRSA